MFKKIIAKIMDPIYDIFLKPFKITLNDFFTYVFSILAVYFTVDRVIELFIMMFKGQCVSYWSPIGYTCVLAVIVAAYCFYCSSTMCTTITSPMKAYVKYSILFRIVATVMAAQWVNMVLWMVLMQVASFKYIATNLPEVAISAIRALSLLLPLLSIRGAVDYYINDVMDADQDWIDSFEDFKGFKLQTAKSMKKIPSTFMCNATICMDDQTGQPAIIPEKKRFEATFVQGATGTGKTSMIVEPMCAMDLERKYFFREVSKKLGFNALQAGLATLEVPYSNEYLNNNFTLSFLKPRAGRVNEYKNYVGDMLKYTDPSTNEMYYRGIGFTLVAPDNACIERVQKVATAYNIPVNIIDPMNPETQGINPFVGKDPAKVAAIISTVLKGMYEAENSSGDNVFFANVTQQAFENLAILLKLVYPRMHNGEVPTLEDMLSILNNFDLAEEMCEILKKDPELAEDYKSLIGYFEKNFYKPPVNIHGYEIASTFGSGRKDTEKFVYGAITQLDNFLRNPGIKRVLCSRTNNVDLDAALQEGHITTVCTRQGDLGEIHQKAFGMFAILSFKDAVLRRPGTEDTRTPHFIYIDEFPLYVNKDTEAFFTLFRKYRCGTLITIQNLSQLTKNKSLAYFKDVIITNTKTQILFGDMTAQESEYWSAELGKKKKWKYKRIMADSKTQEGADKITANLMTAETDYVPYYKPGKLTTLPFKTCVYKTKNENGKTIVGRGKTDFINKKYYAAHTSANYNFAAFGHTSSSSVANSTGSGYFSGEAYRDTKMLSNNSENLIDVDTVISNTNRSVKHPDIFIDVDNDGVNDFIVEPLTTKKELDINSIKNSGDSTIIDLKK